MRKYVHFLMPAAFLLLGFGLCMGAPSAVTGLSVGKNFQISLSWYAPDNGAGNACDKYLLKYTSSANITNDSEFENAETYNQSWKPALPGNPESKILTGLIPSDIGDIVARCGGVAIPC